jgi:hypothetical protein
MPFLSKAQKKWMFANEPEVAKRWAEETPPNKKLPEHVTKKKTRESIIKKLVRNRH